MPLVGAWGFSSQLQEGVSTHPLWMEMRWGDGAVGGAPGTSRVSCELAREPEAEGRACPRGREGLCVQTATLWRPLVGLSPGAAACRLCDPGQLLRLSGPARPLIRAPRGLALCTGPARCRKVFHSPCPCPGLLRHPPGFVTEAPPPWGALLPAAWPCPLALPGSRGGEVVEGTGVTHSWLCVTCGSCVPGTSGSHGPHTCEMSVATIPGPRAAAEVKETAV